MNVTLINVLHVKRIRVFFSAAVTRTSVTQNSAMNPCRLLSQMKSQQILVSIAGWESYRSFIENLCIFHVKF